MRNAARAGGVFVALFITSFVVLGELLGSFADPDHARTAWTLLLLSTSAGSAGQSNHARAMTSPPDRKDTGGTPQAQGTHERCAFTSLSPAGLRA
jgi:hypothetical protein